MGMAGSVLCHLRLKTAIVTTHHSKDMKGSYQFSKNTCFRVSLLSFKILFHVFFHQEFHSILSEIHTLQLWSNFSSHMFLADMIWHGKRGWTENICYLLNICAFVKFFFISTPTLRREREREREGEGWRLFISMLTFFSFFF